MTQDDIIEWIGPWCADRLESFDYFSDITVLSEDKGVIESDIERALSTLNEKAGKLGAVVIVYSPEESAGDPDMPGPESKISINVRVLETPILNRDTGSGGTGKPWSRIGRRVKSLLHHFDVGNRNELVYAGGERVIVDESTNGFDYKFSFSAYDGIRPKVATPSISGTISSVSISCVTPSSVIYYTTDGTYPSSANEDANLYSAPFTVDSGTEVRAAAYLDGYQGSNIRLLSF